MSIIRPSTYPGRWSPVSADAPQGSGKNRTSPTSNDGSYFDQVWFDDMDSLHQALFIASGISPNGIQDVGTASQIFDALINNRWSAIGNYLPGTITKGSDGKQYYCVNQNGRDTSVINPVGDLTDTWREYPHKITKTNTYLVVEHFDGLVEMSFIGSASDSNGVSVCTFPLGLTLEDSNYTPQLTEISSEPLPQSVGIFGVVLNSKSTTGFNAMCISPDGTIRSGENPYVYLSYRKA